MTHRPTVRQGTAGYTDHAALAKAAESSTRSCAKIFADEGIAVFEIGQEWDNLALLPGRGGQTPTQYNATVWVHAM